MPLYCTRSGRKVQRTVYDPSTGQTVVLNTSSGATNTVHKKKPITNTTATDPLSDAQARADQMALHAAMNEYYLQQLAGPGVDPFYMW